MSKAFTKEDDSDIDDDLADPELLLPEGAKNYMTPAGALSFKKEFETLTAERSLWIAESSATGKKKLRQIDRRLRFLSQRLELLQVVDPASQDPKRVLFGARVVVRDENAHARSYQIVGIDEAHPQTGSISWTSPLARVLLNARVGDLVTLSLPRGTQDLEIVSICYF